MKKKVLLIPGALLLIAFIAFMLFECFSFKSISSSYGAELQADKPFTMEQYYPEENWDSVIIMPSHPKLT